MKNGSISLDLGYKVIDHIRTKKTSSLRFLTENMYCIQLSSHPICCGEIKSDSCRHKGNGLVFGNSNVASTKGWGVKDRMSRQ